MQITLKKLDGLKREFAIHIPADAVKAPYQAKLAEVQKSAKINGFRPGKVPQDVLEKKYGQSILHEVSGQLMDEAFRHGIEQEKLKIAGRPEVTPHAIEINKDLEFSIAFEVYPEIELKDLSGAAVEKPICEVKEENVNEMIDRMRRQQAQFSVVERASQTGDRVTLDFEGFMNGEAFEGGKASGFELELGSKQMIPGFEEGVLGMKAGDVKEISVTFPKEYHAANLAGQPATFTITAHAVKEPTLPALDDEFAKKVGFDTVEIFKAEAHKSMTRELQQLLANKLKESVLDQLMALNTIDVPADLIQTEITHLQEMTRQQMSNAQGGKDLSKLSLPRELYEEQAKKRVVLGLLITEVIQKHDLKVDAEKVRAKIDDLAAAYARPEEVVAWYYNNRKSLAEVEASVIEDLAIQKLLENANVSEKVFSYNELVNL